MMQACSRLKAIVCTAVLALTMAGCQPAARLELDVAPLMNREVVALRADDVAAIMSRAGFSDEEIVDIGPVVRNALASHGAVSLRCGLMVEAILAVDSDLLFVASRRRGSFTYPIGQQDMQQPTPMPQSHGTAQ